MQATYFDYGHGVYQPEYYMQTDLASPGEMPSFDQRTFVEQQHLLAMPVLSMSPYDGSHDAPAFSGHHDLPPRIHAPIPISAYSTLLAHVNYAARDAATSPPPSAAGPSQDLSPPPGVSAPPLVISLSPAPQPSPFAPLPEVTEVAQPRSECAHQLEAPQAALSTSPECELQERPAQAVSPIPEVEMTSVEETVPSSSSSAAEAASLPAPSSAKAKNRLKVPTVLQPAQPGRPDNIRKSYFRSVADNVGFQPTDPDSITSHDKKRHYLECLEQYILWLHDQIGLSGNTPLQLERVDSYRGLNIRSIRTLLVHMQGQTKKLHNQVAANEQNYFATESRAMSQPPSFAEEANSGQLMYPAPAERVRRHSIANGMIPMSGASHVPPLPVPAQSLGGGLL
ncbi:hypothetical protein PsYK624_036640 [Phanerochaete sordida]|uniref:Uncharacterized protein n=1 Tax=Phanerochaete sordida TaxID=48140 RepID=A0A9P3L9S8_9APHY|nr:hypothetical protein PsYK624_036640 [Phanerochaete sordida]